MKPNMAMNANKEIIFATKIILSKDEVKEALAMYLNAKVDNWDHYREPGVTWGYPTISLEVILREQIT